MTTTTTTTAAPATLTENDLFAIFDKLAVEHRSSYGATVTSYTPRNLILDGGDHGHLEAVSQHWFDYIVGDERPAEVIETLIDDLEVYLNGLRAVRIDFEAFKAVHEMAPEGDEPSDPAARKAWVAAWEEHERSPRFRATVKPAARASDLPLREAAEAIISAFR